MVGRWVGFKGIIRSNPSYAICRSQQDVEIQGRWRKLIPKVRDSHWLMIYGDCLKEAGFAARKLGLLPPIRFPPPVSFNLIQRAGLAQCDGRLTWLCGAIPKDSGRESSRAMTVRCLTRWPGSRGTGTACGCQLRWAKTDRLAHSQQTERTRFRRRTSCQTA